ncbi:hypothetical protein DICPUDRAFT_42435, partial [Dictyostelium purpureum]
MIINIIRSTLYLCKDIFKINNTKVFFIFLTFLVFIVSNNSFNSNNVVLAYNNNIYNNNNFVNFLEYNSISNCSNINSFNEYNINFNNNNNNKINNKINNKNFVKEYIVMFKKYIDQKDHQIFLNNIFNKVSTNILDSFKWKIIPRNNPASKYPSDFALVEFTLPPQEEEKIKNIEIDSIINLLKQDSNIKYIFPERKIEESMLKKWQNNGDSGSSNSNSYDDSSNSNSEDEFKSLNSRNKTINHSSRKLVSISDNIQVTDLFNTKKLWSEGYSGKGVKVAIFDTGLSKDHPHFKNIVEITDWTREENSNDNVGHGTFVAGIIASGSEKCLGFAPDSDIHIYRVFNSQKESFTSWFIDAFNHAILTKMDVLNLSIGGPDFMDRPFVEKVWEMSANNIIVVSAIGNDGPLYGTLNNPADQSDVIGVGGIDYSDTLASFSSRGMTTWEIPEGYGRVKPDLVAYGSGVYGSSFRGDACKPLSGTSVSSPVVAGAISLLISSAKDKSIINPASMKQILIESADRIKGAGLFEQGGGKLNIMAAKQLLDSYKPKVSISPSQIDFLPTTSNGKETCGYFWPYCTQKLYHTGLPIIVNATIINGVGVASEITNVYWNASRNGDHLQVSFSYQSNIWPWTGHIGVFFTVPEESATFNGVAEGSVDITISTPGSADQIVRLPVRAQIVPKPPRERRILWDQFHNLRYPIGFFPRDALKIKNEPFDWNGDHLHTNFRKLYNKLVELGYFVEIIGSPLTCFDPQNYGTLFIVDPEEEFLPSEIKKIEEDVRNYGLNLIVFADWYNAEVMKMIEFYDENTQQLWSPATGGANIPALNDFLSVFGIYFGDSIYNGEVVVGERVASVSSGTSIIGFPAGGQILEASLTDLTRLIVKGRNSQSKVPILGFFQPTTMENDDLEDTGQVVVFGDSNCLDETLQKDNFDCYWLIEDILNILKQG